MSTTALNIAATGMMVMERKVDNIAHNVSNAETKAFKKGELAFGDLIYQTQTRMGSLAGTDGSIIPTGVQYGLGSQVESTYKVFSQGDLIQTPGVDLNVAINGPGFFVVTLPDGTNAYLRNGEFALSNTGEIVTPQGYVVSPGIIIPQGATNLNITSDGTVEVILPGQTQPQNLGQLELANFINPAGLSAMGSNLYQETAASGNPIIGTAQQQGFGSIKQFWLEKANVDSIMEVMNLINAQRNYEMNSKVMQTAEQMEKDAIDSKI